MAEIECEVDFVQLKKGRKRIDGVRVTCTECGHSTESFGTGENSIRRCLALMREECPEGKKNFYQADEA